MAWTNPKTWAASEYVTAALMNTHLRDNMNYLYALTEGDAGWMAAPDTYLYDSATSFTINRGVVARYPTGTRLKLTNDSAEKYFAVTSATLTLGVTTVNITGGTAYTLADAAITDPYLSYMPAPGNYPVWFDWAPTQDGFSSDPASGVYRFRIDGNVCTLAIRQPTAGTSDANNFTLTLPVTAKTLTNMAWSSSGFATDNNTLITAMGYIASAGTLLTLYKSLSATGWTTSGNKFLNSISIQYEI